MNSGNAKEVWRTEKFPLNGWCTGLLALMVWGTILLVLAGCGSSLRTGGRTPLGGEDWLTIRPYSGDISQILRNAHYFKLMGRLDLAVKELEAGYQQDPANIKVVDDLAHCYEELGNFERAQKLYQEAMAHHNNNPALSNNLCFSLYQAGKYEQAEKCFREALSRYPNNVTARNNLGLLLCRLGRQDEARRLWAETEGETAAQNRLKQALAVLGGSRTEHYAQKPKEDPMPQQVVAHVPDKPAFSGSPEAQISSKDSPEREPASSGQVGKVWAAQPASPAGMIQLASYDASTQEGKFPTALEEAGQEQDGTSGRKTAKTTPPEEVDHHPEGAKRMDQASSQPKSESANQPRAQARAEEPPDSSEPDESPPPSLVKPDKPGGAPARQIDQARPKSPERVFLTAQELTGTAIEVLNGNGGVNLAAKTRSMLWVEGFNVTRIGNHIDWGAKETIIYFKPESLRVAQALQSQFFQGAHLESAAQLPQAVDIRLLLGQDFRETRDVLAKLDE